jgi:hypothetical protein
MLDYRSADLAKHACTALTRLKRRPQLLDSLHRLIALGFIERLTVVSLKNFCFER